MSDSGGAHTVAKLTGLIAGPVLAVVIYLLLPDARYDEAGELLGGLPHAGKAAAALGALMATWWLTEAIPIPATSIIPAAVFPVLGVMPVADAASRYAHELILLFFGGFMLGLAMERHGLHKRIALLTLRLVGTSPRRLVAGFMLASAMLSGWVSNTATTLMMLPIAISVLTLLFDRHEPRDDDDESGSRVSRNLSTAMLLGIAYAASIGGVATLVGTAPNLFLAGFARDNLGVEISMARWITVALPLVVVFIPVCWFMLTTVLFPLRRGPVPGAAEHIANERRALGPMSGGEVIVLIVFCCTAICWMLRPQINNLGDWLTTDGPELLRGVGPPLATLRDASIAAIAAMSLFVIPCSFKRFELTVDWRVADRMPWGILILLGGGLALAKAITDTGVDTFIGGQLEFLAGVPPILIVLAVVTVIIFLTEITSNTAVTTSILPVLAAAAPVIGIDPIRLLVPATIVASLAFMLPVATPPNAIVFGSGRVTIREMARAGFSLNLIGIVLATVVGYYFAGYVVTPAN